MGKGRRREEVRNGWPCEVASVLACWEKGRGRKERSTQDLKAHRGASLYVPANGSGVAGRGYKCLNENLDR